MKALVVTAATGSALGAGVFFAFSGFVMAGLDDLRSARGIEAMKSINRSAETAPLMLLLFGTALLCLGLGVWAVRSWGDPRAVWVLAGALAYLIGTIGITVAANVPLNQALAELSPHAAGAAEEWRRFVHDWMLWNHLRFLTSTAAAVTFILAACVKS